MEFQLIDRIRQRTAQERDDVRLGIGDDAALLRVPAGQELVAAIDTLVEGVHFPVGTEAFDLGWKALAVNLSDLAAMGAAPAWAMMALTLPGSDPGLVDGIADGFASLASRYQVALVGGDTTRGPLSLSVAVHGLVPQDQALLRQGAQIGDAVLVTGTLGDAAAGLALLQQSRAVCSAVAREALLARLNRPAPRVEAGQALRGLAHACIDVSDGLLADLGHICTASGVAAEIDVEHLPLSLQQLEAFERERALGFALHGGDDYELCFTAPPAQVEIIQRALAHCGVPVTRIGRIVTGQGVRVLDGAGRALPVTRTGWDHFKS